MICSRCKHDIPDDANICCYCGKVYVRKQSSRARVNGTGNAYKRGNTWTARVTVGWHVNEDGTRRQMEKTKGGFKTKTEALAYCEKLKAPYERRKTAPALSAYWQTYLKGEYKTLSDSKQTAYRIAWAKLDSLASRRVDTLTVGDLRETVTENAHSYYTARDMKVLLNHLFALAAADRWVSADLPSFIVLPKLEEKSREPFTEAEQSQLWQAYEHGNADAAIPLIMIYTGMMTGEMRRLTVGMIDYDRRQIIGVGLKTKVRRESPVYVPDAILPLLRESSVRALTSASLLPASAPSDAPSAQPSTPSVTPSAQPSTPCAPSPAPSPVSAPAPSSAPCAQSPAPSAVSAPAPSAVQSPATTDAPCAPSPAPSAVSAPAPSATPTSAPSSVPAAVSAPAPQAESAGVAEWYSVVQHGTKPKSENVRGFVAASPSEAVDLPNPLPDEWKSVRLWSCNEDDFYARYYAALEAAGTRRLTPYSCRHTTATALAITENIAPETIRKVMRWTTSAMLNRYAHPDDEHARAAVNSITTDHR